MAKETLSIELDPVLIDRVRQYSEQNGTDIAETIGELISTLPADIGVHAPDATHSSVSGDHPSDLNDDWEKDLPPITRSLLGIASGSSGEEDYKEYLWRKYGQ
ncbi:DUF6364 family protein [Longimicrobium sp.]|uniref:DUF6364 family protein n=1 Tax=Longimicrobium sp. TaxID=2029185 RepID=UPI003B3B6253